LPLIDKKYYLLAALILLHIGFWIIRKPPQPSSDDLVYLNNAKAMMAGEYVLTESPKNHRLVVFAPVALFISALGESPWVISLWPLLCSCITLVALYLFLLKYSGLLHAFTSSLLLATNTLQIDYSASLFPDVIVALFALLFVVQIFKARLNSNLPLSTALLAAFFFYSGFLAKEIIVFVLPFILFLFLKDFKAKENISSWKRIFIAMLSVGIVFFAAYYLFTGDFNFIYHSVDTRHSEFYALQTPSEIFERLSIGPANMFAINVGYIVLFLFVLSNFYFRKSDIKSIRFFSTYFFWLLAVYWLLPISLKSFTLIHLDPRMWMLLLCPLYILAGFNTVKIIEGDIWQAKKTAMIFLTVSILSYLLVSPQRAFLFFLFALSCTAIVFLRQRKMAEIWKLVILLLPTVILALRFTVANSNFLPQ
jgi:hypothetical protein